MGAVWEFNLPPVEKAVLLAMADHAQDDGTRCYPSVERIAAKTGFGERAIQGAIKELRKSGLLVLVGYERGGRSHATEYQIDVTKGARHAYFVTGKGARGAPISTVKGARGSVKGAPAAPETSLTINTTTEKKDDTQTPKTPPPLYDLALALSEVCGMQLDKNKRLFREAKILGAVTPADVRASYGAGGWWYTHDWRGKKGQRPTPAQVRETWGQWSAPSANGRAPESYTDSGAAEFDERMAAAASEPEAARVWRVALVQLAAQMTRATFSAQLHGSTAVALSGDGISCTLTVALASETARGWVEAKMRAKVDTAVSAVAGRPAKVVYVVRESAS